MFDVCVIGQIVKDFNYLRGKRSVPKIAPGGTSFYSTYSYYSLGFKTAVVTSFNHNDKSFLPKQFKNGTIKFFNNKDATTTEFKNIYKAGNINYRKQEVAFNNKAVTGFIPVAKIYHFGPLILNDIDRDLYLKVAKRKGLKVLDIQGLVRKLKNKKVVEQIGSSVGKLVEGFNILKCDTRELSLIKNYSDKKKIIGYLWDKGISEIIVTKGFFGSTIYSRELGKIAIPPFIPSKIKDATGCGDVYTAIYAMARYKRYSIYHAGLLASAGSGLKTENIGPLKKGMNYIKKRVNPICKI